MNSFCITERQIPKRVVEFTYLVADHCELTWAKLDLHRSVEEIDVDESTEVPQPTSTKRTVPEAALGQSAPAPKRSKPDDLTVQQVAAELLERPLAMGSRHLRTVLKEDILEEWAGYLAASDCPLTREIFRGMARIILKDAATWFQYGASSSLRHKLLQVAAENQRKDCAAWLALVACRCLAFLGFGEMVSSSPTQGGGRPVWYFCKRPLSEPRGDASNVPSDAALLTPVLEALGFTATSTPSASAIVTATGKRDNSQPQRASSVAFSPLDPAEVAGRLARLRMLLPEILPEPAHPGEDDVSPTQVASDVGAAAPSLAGVPLCLVAPADAAQLRVVDVPRVGSCFYSCLHLALAAPAEVMEWHCAHRHPNKAAVDLETWLRFVRGQRLPQAAGTPQKAILGLDQKQYFNWGIRSRAGFCCGPRPHPLPLARERYRQNPIFPSSRFEHNPRRVFLRVCGSNIKGEY